MMAARLSQKRIRLWSPRRDLYPKTCLIHRKHVPAVWRLYRALNDMPRFYSEA